MLQRRDCFLNPNRTWPDHFSMNKLSQSPRVILPQMNCQSHSLETYKTLFDSLWRKMFQCFMSWTSSSPSTFCLRNKKTCFSCWERPFLTWIYTFAKPSTVSPHLFPPQDACRMTICVPMLARHKEMLGWGHWSDLRWPIPTCSQCICWALGYICHDYKVCL